MEVGEEYGSGGMAMDDVSEEEEITQEDAWAVISAYFEEKGLVRQQLDSFDEFIQNTMQEIVDESADIEIRPESQHNPARQQDYLEVHFPKDMANFIDCKQEKESIERLCEISLKKRLSFLSNLSWQVVFWMGLI